MKWSLDTHKFMSEITRKALQILIKHNISAESGPAEIEAAERELASSGIYQGGYDSARGRIRRALLTYFKAYGCYDDQINLTETGRLFAENKLSLREFCFHYILNYQYKSDGIIYYPVQLLLMCIKKLETFGVGQGYLSVYDFSRIVECNNISDINDTFIDELISARREPPKQVSEREVGYDVWCNILSSAGIFKRTTEKTLVLSNEALADWILAAYSNDLVFQKGRILTGVFKYIPQLPLFKPHGDASPFAQESNTLGAYLFDTVDNSVIERYIFSANDSSYSEMLSVLGLKEANKSFYANFFGYEHLIGFCLCKSSDPNLQIIGSIITSSEIQSSEMHPLDNEEIIINYDKQNRLDCGYNIIYYGVPGVGKSWTIKKILNSEDCVAERIVFHPDYTNADLVGQIMPVLDDNHQISYQFIPGPFTTILREAYINPLRRYYLVIEEINRGNAPAIFGELFQLLDRKLDGPDETDPFPRGTSEYGIKHKDIAQYVYKDPSHDIRIPSNLSVLATMNTSDQNVFTLDTAFKRRWKMKSIPNVFKDTGLRDLEIKDTGIYWGVFVEVINDVIVNSNLTTVSSEDKRLGAYFATAEEIRNSELFAEKVLAYLWDDVFKYDRPQVFRPELKTLEEVISEFATGGFGSVFTDILYTSLKVKQQDIS